MSSTTSGRGRGCHIIVLRLTAEQQVAHASAGQVRLVPGRAQRTYDLQSSFESATRMGDITLASRLIPPHSRTFEPAKLEGCLVPVSSSPSNPPATRPPRPWSSAAPGLWLGGRFQIATHARYGGVVPELASREHLRAVVPVVRAALRQANVTLADLDAIAVTSGPGLAGALLVGITYAKALAFANNLPLIAVNHLEGHIHAVLLHERELNSLGAEARVDLEGSSARLKPSPDTRPESGFSDAVRPELEPSRTSEGSISTGIIPATNPPWPSSYQAGIRISIFAAPTNGSWTYSLVGRTLDDAAGEAF